MSSRVSTPPVAPKDMLIGALLRVPAQAIHRRIISELNAAGFEDLRVPHMAVLQYPGPDGVRPGVLAERAGMSKQAMNQLLRSLEGLGYLVRASSPEEGRARTVRLTKRGRARPTARSTRFFATSSDSGPQNWDRPNSRPSRPRCSACGRAASSGKRCQRLRQQRSLFEAILISWCPIKRPGPSGCYASLVGVEVIARIHVFKIP